jgi:outer membrane protein OmpA-like peptidoglycan-associated protein
MGCAAGLRNVPAPARDPVRWLAPFSLVCLVVASCVTPTIQPVISAPDDPEFRGHLDTLARAFESMSTDKVLQFYAQDTYSVSFDLPYAFDPTGDDHLRTLERFFAMLKSIRLEPAASTEVWTTEDRVWTTRAYRATGTLKNGDTFRFDGWHSAIWEKRNGTWVIAYEHFGGPEAERAFAAPPSAPPPRPTAEPTAELRLRDVFFAYNKWDIRPDGALNLLANVDMLKANPAVEATIEGHCDERGPPEHNLQLGRKRAEAVKAFLVRNGIAENRLQAVSLGKSRTFARGQGEPAWGLNRRAHFVITRR